MSEQNEPAMDLHPVTDADKIDGIVAQVRADVGDKSDERVADVLRQRLEQAGVAYDDDLIETSLARVREA